MFLWQQSLVLSPLDVPIPLITPWTQYRFGANGLVDEVTGAEGSLVGSASIVGDALNIPVGDASHYATLAPFDIQQGTDFYIRVTTNAVYTSGVETVLARYAIAGSMSYGWALALRQQGRGTPNTPSFTLRDNTGTVTDFVVGSQILQSNVTYTVEVSRVANRLYMFVDGVDVTASQSSTNMASSLLHVGTSSFAGGAYLRDAAVATDFVLKGAISDIQFAQGGVGYPTSTHAIRPLVPYIRPQIAVDDQYRTALQLPFRRGSKICEATGNVLTTRGSATVTKNARLNTTNVSTSYADVPMPYFGAGDFTIEFKANISSTSSFGAGFGHFHSTNTATEDNRWILVIDANRRVGLILAKSAAANDSVGTYSANGIFPLNADTHIVAQRSDGVVRIYVNGEQVAENSTTANFPIRGAAGVFRTQHFNQATFFAGSIWDVRITDYAAYTEV